jgi:hypothetical protein
MDIMAEGMSSTLHSALVKDPTHVGPFSSKGAGCSRAVGGSPVRDYEIAGSYSEMGMLTFPVRRVGNVKVIC